MCKLLSENAQPIVLAIHEDPYSSKTNISCRTFKLAFKISVQKIEY